MGLFASVELAERIERAECDLLKAGVEAVRQARPDGKTLLMPIAGGVASYAGEHSPLNKVAGLGFAGAPGDAALAEIEAAFAERRCPIQVELPTLADPTIGEMLTGRGYRLVGVEAVLGRSLAERPEPAATLACEVVRDDDAPFEPWVDVLVTGFCAPDTQGVASHESFPRDIMESAVREFARAAGFRRYAILRDGAMVAAAGLRQFEGVAHLCGAATLPAHRRRGAQSALLARRLSDAAVDGCDLAVMVAQPGSKSAQNAHRNGFELLYCRNVLVRGPNVDP